MTGHFSEIFAAKTSGVNWKRKLLFYFRMYSKTKKTNKAKNVYNSKIAGNM
jgi:hypothetical protein